jgi:two-component system, cell cycle sensor histidine kinase and response regulator CckA
MMHLVRGCETILLVDDEEATRRTTVLLLQHLGYRVAEARAGEEALRLMKTSEEKIHLLMTDVEMPGMSGVELADALASIDPGLRVLFQSGYSDSTVLRHGLSQPRVFFLQKPFTLNSLAGKVREILDSP